MNTHARRAMRHWKEHRPQAWADLLATGVDPERFFTDLGEQIENQVQTLTRQFAGPDLPGEGYQTKVARLNNARARAVEVAWARQMESFSSQMTRAEWEDEAPDRQEALIRWAEQMAEALAGWHPLQDVDPVETAARRFMVPVEFLKQMVAVIDPDQHQWEPLTVLPETSDQDRVWVMVPPPVKKFLEQPQNRALWEEAAVRRWQRDRAKTLTELEAEARQ